MSDAFDANDPDLAGLKPSAGEMALRAAFQLLRIAVPSLVGSGAALVTYVVFTAPHFATSDGRRMNGFRGALEAPFVAAVLLGGGALVLFDWVAARFAAKRRDDAP